ncbi:hypothetical protein ILYODFUR_038682 [Ilyodon furcidens]|uniref:Uncharacterized protein n=1 Tax=Ilyodon furcidens TaxID=33524 RepID=A0ABV0URL0_9TELE
MDVAQGAEKLFIWRAKNLNRCSSSSGIASEHRAGVSEDGMGGAAATLGDSAVTGEDAGLLPADLTSAGRETTSSPAEPQEGAPRRRLLRREEGEDFTAGPECAARGAEPHHAPSAPDGAWSVGRFLIASSFCCSIQ